MNQSLKIEPIMKFFSFLFTMLLMAGICSAQSYDLSLKLEKGKSYPQKMTSQMLMSQKMMGQDINIDMNIESHITYTVVDVVNGNFDVEVVYDWMRMKMGTPMGAQEFSSETTGEPNPLSDMLTTLKNNKFNMVIDPKGNVVEVKNLDKLFDAMMASTSQLPEMQKQQMVTQMKQSFGPDAFRSNFESSMAIFPDKAVKVGDTWMKELSISAGMNLQMVANYKLDRVEGGKYCISAVTDFKTSEESNTMVTNGMTMKFDLKGTGTSEMKVDQKTGWASETLVLQDIAGKIDMKDVPQMPDGMSIDMKMKGETRMVAE
jgi:hypothetical protein